MKSVEDSRTQHLSNVVMLRFVHLRIDNWKRSRLKVVGRIATIETAEVLIDDLMLTEIASLKYNQMVELPLNRCKMDQQIMCY